MPVGEQTAVNWPLFVNPLGKDKSWFFTDPDHANLEETLKKEEEA